MKIYLFILQSSQSNCVILIPIKFGLDMYLLKQKRQIWKPKFNILSELYKFEREMMNQTIFNYS